MEVFDGAIIGKQLEEEVVDLAKNPNRVWSEDGLLEEGVRLFTTLDLNTNQTVCRIEGVVEAPAELLIDVLSHQDQKEWNEFCTEFEIVEEYDSNNSVVYLCWASSVPGLLTDACYYSRTVFSPETNEYMYLYRSVEHAKVPLKEGLKRFEIFPSGYIITPDEEGKKCTVVGIFNFYLDPPPLKTYLPFWEPQGWAQTGFSVLKNWSSTARRDLRHQYISKLVSRTFKDILDVLTAQNSPSMANGWIKILKMGPHIDVFKKKSQGQDILCTSGVFTMNLPPDTVFRVLSNLQTIGVAGYGTSDATIVEQIDENTKIWHLSWKSAIHTGNVDAALLQSARVNVDGFRMIMHRSVVHNRVPVNPDKIRAEIMPTGYFIYPIKDKGCIISYCIQVNLLTYKTAVRENLEKMFVIRSMEIISNLKSVIFSFLGENSESYPEAPIGSPIEHTPPTSPNMESQTLKPNLDESKILSALEKHERERVEVALRSLDIEIPNIGPLSKKRKSPEYSFQVASLDNKVSNLEITNEMDKHPPSSISKISPYDIAYKKKKPFNFFVSRKGSDTPSPVSLVEILPSELLLSILTFLNPQDIRAFSLVNRRFRFLTEDESLWRIQFEKRWPLATQKIKLDYDWKNTYKTKSLLSLNWKMGRCTPTVLQGHQKSVRCLAFHKDLIVSGSGDKLVKLWSIKSGKCTKTFSGFASGVIAVTLDGTRAMIGYKNGGMKIWDVHSGLCLWEKQFNYRSDGFLFMQDRLISWNQSLQVWDSKTGKLLSTLGGHSKKVNCVETCNNILITGSSDRTVKRWDIVAGKSTHTFSGHTAAINCVDTAPSIAVSGANDKVVKLWDIRANTVGMTFKESAPIKCVRLTETMIITSTDHNIRLWDKRMDRSSFQQLVGHSAAVVSLRCNDKMIISGSLDGNIIVWNFSNPCK